MEEPYQSKGVDIMRKCLLPFVLAILVSSALVSSATTPSVEKSLVLNHVEIVSEKCEYRIISGNDYDVRMRGDCDITLLVEVANQGLSAETGYVNKQKITVAPGSKVNTTVYVHSSYEFGPALEVPEVMVILSSDPLGYYHLDSLEFSCHEGDIWRRVPEVTGNWYES